MLKNKKIAVVIPAYNAEVTLPKLWSELPFDVIDAVIVVDDASHDGTFEAAQKLGATVALKNEINLGYGATQKICYREALKLKADIIVLVHGDYQYTPKLVRAMSSIIAENVYSVVLASRMLGKGAIRGGMPVYKYIANRFLTVVQNFFIGEHLSEYHTGFRAFNAEILQSIPFEKNSNSFIFDNQIILQLLRQGVKIGELTCPTRYASDSSVISFRRSFIYAIQVLWLSIRYRLDKWRLIQFSLFRDGR